MDQKKTGEFLRELRKGKGITQEKAAEQFSVSCRTVSRWETGVNMPDIGIIKEIADFYEVDIRDIINGERSETASGNNDTVSEIIEYASSESNKLAGKVTAYSVAGLIAMIDLTAFLNAGVLSGITENSAINTWSVKNLISVVIPAAMVVCAMRKEKLEETIAVVRA